MNGSRILGLLAAILAIVILISASTFIVSEPELALRVQVQTIIGKDYKPGLHFKVPFVDNIVKFDKRVLTRRYDSEVFLTKESQNLNVDYYIKWQIVDAERFFQATSGGDEQRAQALVGQKIQNGIKAAVASRALRDIVTSDRREVIGEFVDNAGAELEAIGVKVIDVRLQRIDLQDQVRTSVYESMKRTFEGIAQTRRGEGNRDAQIVRADADRQQKEIIAKGEADSQRVKGEGDAEAARIYAEAYNKNVEFYAFFRSLQAYQNSLGRDRDILVISPDSEFFKYLKDPAPGRR